MISEGYIYIKANNKIASTKFVNFQKANYERTKIISAWFEAPKILYNDDHNWLLFKVNNVLVAYPIIGFIIKFFYFTMLYLSYKLQKKLKGGFSYLSSAEVAKYYVDGGKRVFE